MKALEKESYSIDDILSEVKKRREHENQQQANTEPQDKAEPEVQEKEEVKVTDYKAEPEVIEETSEKEEEFTINDTADIEIPTIEEEETQFTDTDEVEEHDGAVIDNQAAKEENKQDKNGMVDLLSLAQNEEVIEPHPIQPDNRQHYQRLYPRGKQLRNRKKRTYRFLLRKNKRGRRQVG